MKTTTQTTLRPYQIEDVAFLSKLDSGACFNEQRTGKTPTSLNVMHEKHIERLVVVCPKTALYPWADECEKWLGVPATVVTGTPAKKQTLIEDWETGPLIISYGSLKATKTKAGLIDILLLRKPQGLILDEAHRIKDRNSANANAAHKLARFIPHRLALTGTPAPNKPDEIWSILHFLYPKRFSSYWNFANYFCEVSQRYNANGNKYQDVGDLKPSKVPELQAILNEFATQRKRKDVMPWLPAKEYQRVRLPATPAQTKYLTELANFFETETVVTQGILDRLIRYRQICLHPALVGLKGTSPKLDWFMDYLTDYPNRPTILFTKFTSFIQILENNLQNIPHGTIIGDTPDKARKAAIADFQSGKTNLLILNIDACKEAITVDRAEAAIFMDKYPPVGDIEQAEDRFIATTQDKANKPHVIYELVIAGTYDEQLYELIKKRAASVDAINHFKIYMERRKTQ